MAQQQNQVRQASSITETSVDITPVAAVFNLENTEIENFVYNYLSGTKGIAGVSAARVHVVRDGNQRPQLSIYVFLNNRSNDIYSNSKNIPEHLRKKMDTGGYKASDKLQKALVPLANRDFKLTAASRDHLVYIKLDEFKVLGLMLAADPRQHYLSVTEVVKLKKNRSVTTVIKSNKFVDKNTDSFDKYTNIIEREQH